jgi:hypothetical protein
MVKIGGAQEHPVAEPKKEKAVKAEPKVESKPLAVPVAHPASHEVHAPHDAHTPVSAGEKLSFLLIALVSLMILFNQFQITQVSGLLVSGGSALAPSGPTAGQTSGTIKLDASGDVVNSVIKALIPTGTPKDYGKELGVSFDNPVPGLQTLARLDQAIPTKTLTPDEFKRYVGITTKISCEFCCSAPAVTDNQGRDLCGCAHSAAFRGLTKYIIKTHPTTWTDDQIYWDLTRWKSLFYPKNMVQKGVALVQNGLDLDPAKLNDAQLLAKLQSGKTADIGSLPDMVGGC